MSRWFRFYDEALNDPKVQRLPGDKFKAWVNLLCVASKNDGVLPSLADLAFALRKSDDEVQNLLDELCCMELLDPVEAGYEPHNWKARQFKSDVSTNRVQEFRKRQRNVSPAVSETPPETEQIQIQIQKQSRAEKKEARVADALSLGFEQFWKIWPNKVGKPAALKALAFAIRRGADIDAILAGVERYIRDKPPDRPWLNPATFLNQARWEDQPAQTQPAPQPFAKPTSVHQLKQLESRNILHEMGQSIARRSGEPDSIAVRHDSGNGRQAVCGGADGAFIQLPAKRH